MFAAAPGGSWACAVSPRSLRKYLDGAKDRASRYSRRISTPPHGQQEPGRGKAHTRRRMEGAWEQPRSSDAVSSRQQNKNSGRGHELAWRELVSVRWRRDNNSCGFWKNKQKQPLLCTQSR